MSLYRRTNWPSSRNSGRADQARPWRARTGSIASETSARSAYLYLYLPVSAVLSFLIRGSSAWTLARAAASSLAIGELRELRPEVVVVVFGDLFEVGDRTAEAGGDVAEDPGVGVEAVVFVQVADGGALFG